MDGGKKIKKLIIFSLSLILLVLIGFNKISAKNCGGTITCACDDTLNESRTLTSSDTVTSTICPWIGLRIGTPGITLDCNGRLIQGDGHVGDYGIYINSKNGVTIKNCKVTKFNTGIYISASSDSTLTSNNASYNNGEGIYISSSSGNTLTGNNASYNIVEGILLSSSSNNYLTNNIANNNNYAGIILQTASNNNLIDNTANSNSVFGIVLQVGNSEEFTTGNTFTGNNASFNGGNGIHLANNCNNNVLNSNTANNNDIGIYFFSTAYNNNLNSNYACSNSVDIDDDDSNSGDENTCGIKENWDDTGTTGCTYNCAVPCTEPCCYIENGTLKEYGAQPTGYTDYYDCLGPNSPTGTNYVRLNNYYCNGVDADDHLSQSNYDTCGICEYCTSGDSSCNYYGTDTMCHENDTTYYGCPWGTMPSNDTGRRYGDKYCSGINEGCNGPIVNKSWEVYDDCTLSELCVVGKTTCNAIPTATISSPTNPTYVLNGTNIYFSGYGTDTDGYITAYNWRSSIDGQLGTSQSFSYSSLSIGVHTIYFKVRDNYNTWSPEITLTVKVKLKPEVWVVETAPDEPRWNENYYVEFKIKNKDSYTTLKSYSLDLYKNAGVAEHLTENINVEPLHWTTMQVELEGEDWPWYKHWTGLGDCTLHLSPIEAGIEDAFFAAGWKIPEKYSLPAAAITVFIEIGWPGVTKKEYKYSLVGTITDEDGFSYTVTSDWYTTYIEVSKFKRNHFTEADYDTIKASIATIAGNILLLGGWTAPASVGFFAAQAVLMTTSDQHCDYAKDPPQPDFNYTTEVKLEYPNVTLPPDNSSLNIAANNLVRDSISIIQGAKALNSSYAKMLGAQIDRNRPYIELQTKSVKKYAEMLSNYYDKLTNSRKLLDEETKKIGINITLEDVENYLYNLSVDGFPDEEIQLFHELGYTDTEINNSLQKMLRYNSTNIYDELQDDTFEEKIRVTDEYNSDLYFEQSLVSISILNQTAGNASDPSPYTWKFEKNNADIQLTYFNGTKIGNNDGEIQAAYQAGDIQIYEDGELLALNAVYRNLTIWTPPSGGNQVAIDPKLGRFMFKMDMLQSGTGISSFPTGVVTVDYHYGVEEIEDLDNDGINDTVDICPNASNADQKNSDNDTLGNACDNCILVDNQNQRDTNDDGFGNICDPDVNNDGNVTDGDIQIINSRIGTNDPDADLNGDGTVNDDDLLIANKYLGKQPGPTYDLDSDIDGLINRRDNCWFAPNTLQNDTDNDCSYFTMPYTEDPHCGDACDNCPNNSNPGQDDADNDKLGDLCDNCTDTDKDGYGNLRYPVNTCPDDNCPTIYNPLQINSDADMLGDTCDNCWYVANPYQNDTNINCPQPPYTTDPICGDACEVVITTTTTTTTSTTTTISGDTTPPQYSNPQPQGSILYNPQGGYTSSITWTDNVAVADVVLEMDGVSYSYGSDQIIKSGNTYYFKTFSACAIPGLTGGAGGSHFYMMSMDPITPLIELFKFLTGGIAEAQSTPCLVLGAHTYRWSAKDTSNNWAYTGYYTFTIFRTDPVSIYIDSPENRTYSSNIVDIKYLASSPFEISWVGYSLDNNPNATLTGNTSINVAEGTHNMIFYATTVYDVTNSSDRIYFTVSLPTTSTTSTTTIRTSTTTRQTTTTVSCTCTAWKPTYVCCPAGKGKWTRTCTPKGCQAESKCEGFCSV